MDAVVIPFDDSFFSRNLCMNTVVSVPGSYSFNPVINTFKDNEKQFIIKGNVRGKIVFLVGSLYNTIQEKLLTLAISAARDAKAEKIIPIITYFGYARDDVRTERGASLGSKVLIKNLEAHHPTSFVLFDIHNEHILGYFDLPVDHVDGFYIFKQTFFDIFNNLSIGSKITMMSPDNGGIKRLKWTIDGLKNIPELNTFLKAYSINFAYCNKYRDKPYSIEKMEIVGNVSDSHVIILDDILDTGGTILKCSSLCMESGAKKVTAIITHPVFSSQKETVEKIEKGSLDHLFVADTIPTGALESSKITVVPIEKPVLTVIKTIVNNYDLTQTLIRY